MYSYATVEDYELLTDTVVPTEDRDHVQALLDVNSDMAGIYMGEPCATTAAAKYPELLSAMVCYRTFRQQTIPAGVQSESVGSSSVSYMPSQTQPVGLLGNEAQVLDMMCGRNAYGRGIGSVSFAGAAFVTTEPPQRFTLRAAALLGFPSTWHGWRWTNYEAIEEE